MQKIGKFWLPDNDTYFAQFLQHGEAGFELDHLDTALKYVDNFNHAVDGGAHIGTWSIALAKRFQQVTSIEANPDTFKCLEKNLTEHGVKNVDLYNIALGAESATAQVQNDKTRAGNTGSNFVKVDNNAGLCYNTVSLHALDIFGFDVDFLKLDIEGFEYYALQGAAETIKHCSPVILVEAKKFPGRYPHGPDDVAELLASWGYRIIARTRNDCVYKRI